MYKVKRQLPGIYYAEISDFSFGKLVQLRQDLRNVSDYYDEFKDVVIWKMKFKIAFNDSSDKITAKQFIRQNPVDYGHTIIITNNPVMASIMQMFHAIFPKLLGDVSFARDLEDAVEKALLIQEKKKRGSAGV